MSSATPSTGLTQARLTYLQVKYDLSKPVFVNNPVPIRFGITSSSADPTHPATQSVFVVFSFVEAAPTDPANPRRCATNGVNVKLVGNGVEQRFEADLPAMPLEADLIPTSACASWAGSADGPVVTAHLAVDFDPGLANMPTGIDYPPVVFSAANAGAADNQVCRKALDPNAANPGRGCAYELKLEQTPTDANGKPLIDVKLDSLKPDSSVAVLWPTAEAPDVPQGMREDDPPAVLVNATLVMDGRDPYKIKIDPNAIDPEFLRANPTIAEDLKFGLSDEELNGLDDLPATAAMKYDIVPTGMLAANAWLPLSIDDPANPNPEGHVQEIALTELAPGTDNGVAHALYIDGDTRTAVSEGGMWADQTDFTVRGCLVASFPEGGNAGEEVDPEDMPAGGDVMNGDCRTFKVALTRPPVASGAANAHSFDLAWTRSIGGDTVSISGNLRTSNTLDLSGARTDSEGSLGLKGRIGADFAVQLARIFAKGSALTALASSNVDVGVDAFGTNIQGFMMMGSELTYTPEPFKVAKSFQFPGLTFGFGPVSVGITTGVGGELGLAPSLTVSAKQGGEQTIPELMSASSNGLLSVKFTPSISMNGNVTGGIQLLVAKAGVVATLQVVEIGFPVTGTMRWGVAELDSGGAVKKLTVLGDLNWDLTLNWLNVNLDLVGSVGIGWFSKDLTINVFKYTNSPETQNLLMRKLESPITLE